MNDTLNFLAPEDITFLSYGGGLWQAESRTGLKLNGSYKTILKVSNDRLEVEVTIDNRLDQTQPVVAQQLKTGIITHLLQSLQRGGHNGFSQIIEFGSSIENINQFKTEHNA